MGHKVRRNINWLQAKRFFGFCLVVLIFLGGAGIVFSALLAPLLISAFLTYLLAPFVDFLDRYKVPRPVVVALIVTGFVGVLVYTSYNVFPFVYSQVQELVNLVPKAMDAISSKLIPAVSGFVVGHELMDQQAFEEIVNGVTIMSELTDQFRTAINTIWRTVPQVLGTVVNIVLVPLVSFVLLKDLHRIQHYLHGLIPLDLRKPTNSMLHRINLTLRSVIKGQAMVAGILTIMYIFGLSVVGLKSAFAIGLVAGICRLIPYLDVVVGGALSTVVLVSHFAGWGQVMAVVGVFVFVQSVDGMYITPRVIGERVGLHPIIVIMSIFAFGDLLGFVGVLIAIPVIALMKNMWQSILPFYFGSEVYRVSYASGRDGASQHGKKTSERP